MYGSTRTSLEPHAFYPRMSHLSCWDLLSSNLSVLSIHLPILSQEHHFIIQDSVLCSNMYPIRSAWRYLSRRRHRLVEVPAGHLWISVAPGHAFQGSWSFCTCLRAESLRADPSILMGTSEKGKSLSPAHVSRFSVVGHVHLPFNVQLLTGAVLMLAARGP